MSEYVEASPKARQIFFLAVLLLVGALGIITQWESRGLSRNNGPDDNRSVVKIMEAAKANSYRQALLTSLGQIPFALLGLWFGSRLMRELRWPLAGMPMPFRTRIKHYKSWQAALLAFVAAASPIAVAVLAWINHEARVEYFTEIANEAQWLEKDAAQHVAEPDA